MDGQDKEVWLGKQQILYIIFADVFIRLEFGRHKDHKVRLENTFLVDYLLAKLDGKQDKLYQHGDSII